MRRSTGTGTIERRVNRDGSESFRARVVLADGRASSPWLPSPEAAEAFAIKMRDGGHKGEIRATVGLTLADFWAEWVAELRALRKPRAKHYERTWRQHIGRYPIADMPLARIDRKAVRDFAAQILRAKVAGGTRTIATNTARNAWSLLSGVLSAAAERERIPRNPIRDVRVEWPTPDDDGAAEYLEPDEIARLLACEAVPLDARLIIQFALGTGLRAGELVHMPLADLDRAMERGELLVRHGSKGRAPKSGKTRTIPLLPLARDAAVRWLAMIPTFAPTNPERLAFPTALGCRRNSSAVVGVRRQRRPGDARSRFVPNWPLYLAAAGVRRVTWHGLRHTCGAALASGWWGRTWSLHEIRDLLGHASVTTTERFYGHLAPSALRAAAEATTGGVPANTPSGQPQSRKPAKKAANGESGYIAPLSYDPPVFAGLGEIRDIAGLRADVDARVATGWRPTADEASAVARAVLALDPVARAAQAVLDAPPAYRARRLIALLELLPATAPDARRGAR